MKKYLSLLVVLLMVFTINASLSRAEEDSATGDLRVQREEAKKKMEAMRATLKTEKDAAKAKIAETRIEGREKALERFDGAVLRMKNLKDRVNAEITKLTAKGVNVTVAKALVVTAETKLAAATVKIAEANALLALSTEKLSKENKTKLMTLAKETQSLIKEAHEALNDAIKSLKTETRIKLGIKEKDDDKDDSNTTQ